MWVWIVSYLEVANYISTFEWERRLGYVWNCNVEPANQITIFWPSSVVTEDTPHVTDFSFQPSRSGQVYGIF